MAPHSIHAATLDDIDALAREYQRSRIILTAVELDVFTAVGTGPTPTAVVAGKLETDVRATDMLLNALAALGLLTKGRGGFCCTPMVCRHLVQGAEEDARAPYLHGAQLWRRWSELTECVRTGRPPAEAQSVSPSPRAFIGTMHRYALEQSPALLAAIDLKGVRRVLDLGGGSGAYGIAFARALSGAEVVVFDHPEIIALARETIQAAGLSEHVGTMAGDILVDDFGNGYDVIWLSNVVHAWGPEDVQEALGRIRQALNPGGRLLLRDFILNEEKTEPPFGTVFALNMLVSTQAGNCYSLQEYRNWLLAAGFREVTLMTPPHGGATAIIEATV